jgi:hypothetical protein
MDEELDRRPTKHWQDIVREVEQEANPTRIRALTRELNEAMLREERRKVAQKLGLMQRLSQEGKLTIIEAYYSLGTRGVAKCAD